MSTNFRIEVEVESNKMIANPEKFNALIVKKDLSDTSGVPMKLKDHNIQ